MHIEDDYDDNDDDDDDDDDDHVKNTLTSRNTKGAWGRRRAPKHQLTDFFSYH
jgi:hypothetical protein